MAFPGDQSVLIVNFLSRFSEFYFEGYMPQITNMKKEVIHLHFLHEYIDLLIMPLKQLPISTEHDVKDPLVIGQFSTGFRSFIVRKWILKIRRVQNIHLQLMTNICKQLLNKNLHQSVREISQAMGVTISTILHHLQKIGLVKKLSINEFHMNSVKVKELYALKCVWWCFCRTQLNYFLIK